LLLKPVLEDGHSKIAFFYPCRSDMMHRRLGEVIPYRSFSTDTEAATCTITVEKYLLAQQILMTQLFTVKTRPNQKQCRLSLFQHVEKAAQSKGDIDKNRRKPCPKQSKQAIPNAQTSSIILRFQTQVSPYVSIWHNTWNNFKAIWGWSYNQACLEKLSEKPQQALIRTKRLEHPIKRTYQIQLTKYMWHQ